jgi:Probable lipoprotein LpqN
MIQIAGTLRVFAGGLAAGAIGVTAFAGATASADPALPAPPPAPAAAAPAPAPQNVMAAPGQVPSSRLLATPPAANPFAPNPATAPAPAAVAPAAPTPPAVTPTVSGTLREYLQSKGVKLEAQRPQGFKALDITLPLPTRWTQVPDPNVPDAFAVIADRSGTSIYTSNAQVVVYKLVGNFDPKETITHGFVDSQQLVAWQTTNASMADFGGFPSSIIEGTYRDGDMLLNTSRRHVVATSGRDKYLVSLSVTTDRSVAIADAPATDAIINGFRVIAPGTTAPAPVPGPATAPVGVPSQAAGAAPVGLPPQPTGAAPVGLPPQSAAAAPVGLPSQPVPPNQVAAPRPAPNLLTMVPGLPPLPNFAFLQGR